jgi:phage terminase large subunit-like protein
MLEFSPSRQPCRLDQLRAQFEPAHGPGGGARRPAQAHFFRSTLEGGHAGISQVWKLTGAIRTAERKFADRSLRHNGQAVMAWSVANARVDPKGNAIIVTKQVLGSAKIDPLMAAFTSLSLLPLR